MASVEIDQNHSILARGQILIVFYDSVKIYIPAATAVVIVEEGVNYVTIRSTGSIYKLNYLFNTNFIPASTIDYSKQILSLIRSQDVEKYTAFGSLMTSEITPVFQVKGVYNQLNSRYIETFTAGNGSVQNLDSSFNVAAGTGLGDYGTMRSVRTVNYRPGQGVLTRFSSKFQNPVAGYNMIAGLGNVGNGFFFGYNGTSFGILRQYGGKPASRLLTVTVAASVAGNATVTLNDVVFNVPLTNAGGSTAFTAYQIANFTYTGWNAESFGSTVVFVSTTTGLKAGVYSYVGGTTLSTASFSTLVTGVSETNEWTPQASWSVDQMDGDGPSGQILDTSKGNVFQIKYQWLGYGQISFFIEDSETGSWQNVHNIKYANKFTEPSVLVPSFRSLFASYSDGGTGSQPVLSVVSFGTYIEGKVIIPRIFWSQRGIKTLAANTETNIIAVKCKQELNGIYNISELLLQAISAASDGNRNVVIRIYKNVTSLGANTTANYPQWINLSTDSLVLYDTTSTTRTGGIIIGSFVLGKADSTIYSSLQDSILQGNENIVITAESAAVSEVSVALNWNEFI